MTTLTIMKGFGIVTGDVRCFRVTGLLHNVIFPEKDCVRLSIEGIFL